MAVGDNTYGSVAKVQVLVGDLVTGRVFGNTTIPTLTQVEVLLDDVAAQINMELEQNGYTVPVTSAGSPQAYAYLQAINSYGAAALVLSTLPAEAYVEPNLEMPAQGRRQFFQQRLNEGLERIRNQELPALRTIGLAERFYAGSQEDRDTGETKNPIFKRGLTDYPGSRVLQE